VQPKKYKPKICKGCGIGFLPTRPFQAACGPVCALKVHQRQRTEKDLKALRRADRQRRIDIRTVSEWKRLLQAEFNKFIRNRDAHLPCVSCGTTNPKHTGRGGAWDCGHYLSRGSRPELRFSEQNCAKQCKKCNSFGSGRVQDYRLELIKRTSLETVEWLKGPHEPNRYRVQDLVELLAEYKEKNKQFKD
jgi:hypothetical protein